jgi:hypothetical protein
MLIFLGSVVFVTQIFIWPKFNFFVAKGLFDKQINALSEVQLLDDYACINWTITGMT